MIASIRSKATWAQNIRSNPISETIQTTNKIYYFLHGINTIKTEKRNEDKNKSVPPLQRHWAIFTTNVDRERCLWHTHRTELKSHSPVCWFILKKHRKGWTTFCHSKSFISSGGGKLVKQLEKPPLLFTLFSLNTKLSLFSMVQLPFMDTMRSTGSNSKGMLYKTLMDHLVSCD